jgi:hypothetical protein
MTNLERLKLEISGITITDAELSIRLQENGLTDMTDYDPDSKSNQKAILKTALSVLEAAANNLEKYYSYESDGLKINNSTFADKIQLRINSLERKIRLLPDDDAVYQDGASFQYMFSE